MTKISIIRRKDRVRKDGSSMLYAVTSIAGEKVRIPTHVHATPEEWNPEKEILKGRSKDIYDRNLILADVKARITELLVHFRLSGEKLTKEDFIAYYNNQGNTIYFIEYAINHLKELQTVLKPQTQDRHYTVLKKLKAYNPKLTFKDMTTDWLRIYAAHLRDHYHNNPGTIGKNLSIIRMHYFSAMRSGLTRSNPFEAFRMPQSDPSVVYLNENELDQLIRLYKSNSLRDIEQTTLRFFLFMTFTGMHISDARSTQIQQIQHGELHYRRVKTGSLVHVPISEPAEKLISYFRQDRKVGNLFRDIPKDSAFNRYIKIVGEKAGITKNISAKTARHTFATLYYKKNNGDIGTLSKLLGHKSIKTTMIYAHIMKDSRVAGVSVFNGLL